LQWCYDKNMNVSKKDKEQWKVEVKVTPGVEWEKLGLGTIEIDIDTTFNFERQVEGGSIAYVTLLTTSDQEVYGRVESIMKSLIALLALEDRRKYEIHMGCAQQKSESNKDGCPPTVSSKGGGPVHLASMVPFTFQVVPRLEDLDTGLMMTVINLLNELNEDNRDRLFRILNILYDGLNASTDVQCFLSIYGGLNFITSSVGKKANTVLSDSVTLFEFLDANIIDTATAKSWMAELHRFHCRHYEVLKDNKVDREEVEAIRAFFKEILQKYIKYVSKQ
jgi:hypothetical protein